ncbi:MAG: tryptophan synthase alpha chain [Gaiellales bacterium]|nr:tryptophan synthase alpha chain [Gaiellales bacterium]
MKLHTPALAIYLMAGDGLPDHAAAAVEAGATAIEVGIPFSDPLADGPTIQRAAEAALAAGMTPPRCLEVLAATRARLGDEVPLIPMTYAAIVERYGIARFCADAASAGATGLIVADVPPDDGDDLQAESARSGIDLVQLVALTSADARLAMACRTSRGFIYVVSAIGTTGAREELDVERVRSLLARVRANAGELPLLCGFGVSRASQVRALRAAGADGVIVGSAAIAALEGGGVAGLSDLVGSLARGL